MTFFDFLSTPKGVHSTDEIAKIAVRVPSDAALDYWRKAVTASILRAAA